MKDKDQLLLQTRWRIIDQSTAGLQMDAIQSFGYDDTLCASVGSNQAPSTARLWVHSKTVVLGIQDTKLPHLFSGVDYLRREGYEVIVRNSGGLAVVLDEGILNITLVFPEKEKGIDINRGYDTMYSLIKEMFVDFDVKIEAGEITGSYCPGSYDLSIGGKKFAGISQRRLRRGVAVQIYLCVNGSGSERAMLVRNFYDRARKEEETKFSYPIINPTVMASLSELLGQELSNHDMIKRLLIVLKNKCDEFYLGNLTAEEMNLFEGYVGRIIERNQVVFESQQKPTTF